MKEHDMSADVRRWFGGAIKVFALAGAAIAMTSPAYAGEHAYIIGSYQWSFTDSNGTATITGVVTNPGGDKPSGSLEIPSSINGYTVVNIGDEAIYSCPSLTAVSIPASVTNIGNVSFNYCSSLKSFTVASGNKSYKSKDNMLLSKDGKTRPHPHLHHQAEGQVGRVGRQWHWILKV